jgi:hypothetical protein
MVDKWGTALDAVADFPDAARQRLAELWVTTAEEFVSIARREDGLLDLAEYLSVSQGDVVTLVERVIPLLPPGIPFDEAAPEELGRGALPEPTPYRISAGELAFEPLPNSVNLSNRFPPVRHQGARGTCVAHACAAVREFLLGTNGPQSDLSEQFLYWACKERDGYPESGTWISVAMTILEVMGVCREPIWPYNGWPIAGNEGQGPPPAQAQIEAVQYKTVRATRLPERSVPALRQALADQQPVAFSVDVFSYWQQNPVYISGDIRLPLSREKEPGGHAMCLVGYEVDEATPGGGYFIVRNSWGTDWAHEGRISPGYARLPFAYVEQYGTSAFTTKVESSQNSLMTAIAWFRRLLKA